MIPTPVAVHCYARSISATAGLAIPDASPTTHVQVGRGSIAGQVVFCRCSCCSDCRCQVCEGSVRSVLCIPSVVVHSVVSVQSGEGDLAPSLRPDLCCCVVVLVTDSVDRRSSWPFVLRGMPLASSCCCML